MKNTIAIIIGGFLIFSLTGISILDSGIKAAKAFSEMNQIVNDKEYNIPNCPYLKNEKKSSCPYLNDIHREAKLECPYLKGDAVCPFTRDKPENGNCPYLKDKEAPAKYYRTIKQTSS